MPDGAASYVPDEPTTLEKAKASSEWHEDRARAREVNALINNSVWAQVECYNDKLVVATKVLYKRKIGEDRRVENCNCRLVARVYHQIKGLHYFFFFFGHAW